jgi:tellurite resistance protein TerC
METVTSILFAAFLGKPAWMWLSFLAIILVLLVADLGLFHKTDREIGITESLTLSAIYISLGLAFGGWVWWSLGATAGWKKR